MVCQLGGASITTTLSAPEVMSSKDTCSLDSSGSLLRTGKDGTSCAAGVASGAGWRATGRDVGTGGARDTDGTAVTDGAAREAGDVDWSEARPKAELCVEGA